MSTRLGQRGDAPHESAANAEYVNMHGRIVESLPRAPIRIRSCSGEPPPGRIPTGRVASDPAGTLSCMDALRDELAAVAARLIVEDGLDYANAKRKATRQVLGPGARVEVQPDNADIQDQVKLYLALFHGDDHPRLLWNLRRAALNLMEEFAEFRPHLAGAVWNGTATAHSGLHVLLFADDSKAVEIHCINRDIAYRAGEAAHYAGRQPVERLEFEWPLPGPPVRGRPPTVAAALSLYPLKDERGVLLRNPRSSGKQAERGNLQAVRALVQAGPAHPSNPDIER